MFAVIVHHDTGGDLQGNLILAVNDIKLAVNAAREAEGLGYKLESEEARVSIMRVSVGHTYRKDEFRFEGKIAPKGHPAIYWRRKIDGEWQEEWFQQSFRDQFEGKKTPAAA